MLDLVVRGGTLVDGTGTAGRLADVAIRDGRIVAVGRLDDAPAVDVMEADGMIVAPGFVDVHSHSDATLLSAPGAPSKVRQGVTTEVNGNCGMGTVPFPSREAEAIRAANATIDPDLAGDWSWRDLPGYADTLRRGGIALNDVPLVGHIPLRIAAAGRVARPLDTRERDALLGELEACLDAGAPGCSTGLMFPPAMSATRDELVAIGSLLARRDRLFAVHMRNYGDRLLEAVDEIVDVARETGCRLQVSHLAVAGRRNWGKVPQALERIDAARRDGVDVGVDIYPYVAGSANLSQLLPEWAQAGGASSIVERLGREADRRRILREWQTSLVFGWDEIEVASREPDLEDTLGSTIERVGDAWAMEPALAALELVRRSHDRVVMVAYGRSEDDLRAVLCHPATSIGSDGLAMDPDGPSGAGRPHPRNYGCYPRFLGRYVRDGGLMPLEQAIAMCTSRPAERLRLGDRGRVVEGGAADLVVFDADTVIDHSTFQDPGRHPSGIHHVIVGGAPVVRSGVQTAARPGRVVLV
jgi:N-acyl-D-aspartate/D-glutamate deacylase